MSSPTTTGASPAVPVFVERLRDHGEQVAVITGGEQLTYRQLADRVHATAELIGGGRRLVLVETGNDVAALVGYLAALHGGHVALLADRREHDRIGALVERFDPDVVIGADGRPRRLRAGSAHDLHPELALLLTTSGSTGTPRLVRLSASALDANAAAIATYLGITGSDRAALTLPLHYCYGLSVVNSNLLAGAGLLLSAATVLDTRFWDDVRAQHVTSLHGVPYSFELFDAAGLDTMDLPDLRYVTQAGGKLAPDQVRRWARTGREHGWDLFVMYGQTEATARMAYLPPHLAEHAPEAIGVAVPGGSLSVEGPDDELVYRGPNMMLGYAEAPADLALGRTVHELHTGDLGRRRPDGLFEVIGRRSRFVKPFGIRTDLDGLEHLLAAHGIEAACTGTDDRIVIAARVDGTGDLVHRVLELIGTARRLPATVLSVIAVEDLPRLPNGKIDHPAIARQAGATPPGPAWRRRLRHMRARCTQHPPTIREVFTATFPGGPVDDDASFVELGGDSLTFVRVAADVERVLGHLPQAWEHIPLRELETMATPPSARRRASVETAVLIRALAIIMVVGEHAHLWQIVGGAHLLLALAGWTFARFTLAADRTGKRTDDSSLPRRILRSAARIALPSSLWIAFRAMLHNVRLIDVLLVGSLVPPLVAGYWFVDDLVQILVLLAVMFALPALRGLERRHPFWFAAGLMTLALPGRLYPTAYAYWFGVDIYSTQVVLWLFVLGWLVHRATTRPQHRATSLAILVLVPTFFGTDALRSIIVVAGLLLIQYLPTITVPRRAASVASAVASASLGIYLTHFGVLPLATLGVPPLLVTATSILTGIAAWWLLSTILRHIALRRADPLPRPEDRAEPRILQHVGSA